MLGRCLLSILHSLQLSQCYSAVPQQWEVTGHWHLFRANGRSPSSHQQGAQHCSCEVHELAVALPGAGEKPTITGCRCNGSPHGKPLTCLKNCLHSPHPDGFVMEGVHQSTTADCNEPPFSFPGCYGHGHVCIGNAFAALGFLAHLMPLRQVSIWIPRTRPECVAQSLQLGKQRERRQKSSWTKSCVASPWALGRNREGN